MTPQPRRSRAKQTATPQAAVVDQIGGHGESLAVFVAGFACSACSLLGTVFFTVWGGAGIGGFVGVFFGLAFGGVLPRRIADWCFGPEQPDVQ